MKVWKEVEEVIFDYGADKLWAFLSEKTDFSLNDFSRQAILTAGLVSLIALLLIPSIASGVAAIMVLTLCFQAYSDLKKAIEAQPSQNMEHPYRNHVQMMERRKIILLLSITATGGWLHAGNPIVPLSLILIIMSYYLVLARDPDTSYEVPISKGENETDLVDISTPSENLKD